MVVVSPDLVNVHLKGQKLLRMYQLLETDIEVQTYLKMANIMAVNRLRYNDHGPVHSRIIVGSALELHSILADEVTPSLIKDNVGDLEDSKIVVLCGAYLHDIGNAVHRVMHHLHGYIMADPILNRLLPMVYDDKSKILRVKQEILSCIFSQDETIQCLSIESGIVKVADGTDMAEGRARIPYKTGKVDIHSLSALSIRRLDITRGDKRPIQISVEMENPSGVFQIEWVLKRKIDSSGLQDYIEVIASQEGKEIKAFTWGNQDRAFRPLDVVESEYS